jgi:hypothetical protein
MKGLRRSSLRSKFQHYEVLRSLLVLRLSAALRELAPPPFAHFLRGYVPFWDDFHYNRLRPTHEECVEASMRVADGSSDRVDLCLYSALLVYWQNHGRDRWDQEYSSGEGYKALLYLAQESTSKVKIRAHELALSPDAAKIVEADARTICALLGPVKGLEVPNLVSYRCRADYGDAELAAEGWVSGRADVVFGGGPLEIKALKGEVGLAHAAQVVWYASSTKSSMCWLWDVYRRRILKWSVTEHSTYLRRCISAYLFKHPPPAGTNVIWPQEVRV